MPNGLLHSLVYLDGDRAAAVPAAFGFERDFASTRRWPDLPYDTASAASRYDDASRQDIVRILDAATTLFRARAPAAMAFVDEHMATTLFRRSEVIQGASSASNREVVGCCLFTNLERADHPALVCAEGLVHESIHQHLYRIELRDGSFCDLSDARTYRSPWSGKRIPLHSLVHATFVWFGLATLWCQLARTAPDRTEAGVIRDRIAQIVFGFTFLPSLLASPGFPRASIAPQIQALMGRMAQAATAAGLPCSQQSTLAEILETHANDAWRIPLATELERLDRREMTP